MKKFPHLKRFLFSLQMLAKVQAGFSPLQKRGLRGAKKYTHTPPRYARHGGWRKNLAILGAFLTPQIKIRLLSKNSADLKL
jgi:hypothetical protein